MSVTNLWQISKICLRKQPHYCAALFISVRILFPQVLSVKLCELGELITHGTSETALSWPPHHCPLKVPRLPCWKEDGPGYWKKGHWICPVLYFCCFQVPEWPLSKKGEKTFLPSSPSPSRIMQWLVQLLVGWGWGEKNRKLVRNRQWAESCIMKLQMEMQSRWHCCRG